MELEVTVREIIHDGGLRKLKQEDISAPESYCTVRHSLAIWQGMQLVWEPIICSCVERFSRVLRVSYL